ncbi:hypothetical protein EUX98_g5698 [Antrodiella citrinella]|uniref:Uncharacterized protein n=1 Tax=Antrodiella citrinella TaxID=2447956 RepID=A0A4S4MYJ9_9APHY|nr:hypothetical protein EUX98_g5698 [Antrodiella citrinella]
MTHTGPALKFTVSSVRYVGILLENEAHDCESIPLPDIDASFGEYVVEVIFKGLKIRSSTKSV